jgi:hypothetical protein
MRPYLFVILMTACARHEAPPPRAAIDEWDVAQRNTATELLGVGYAVNKEPVPDRQTRVRKLAKDAQHRNFYNYAVTLSRRCIAPGAAGEDPREASTVEALYRALNAITSYELRDDILIGETYALARADVAKLGPQIERDESLEASLRACLEQNTTSVAAELTGRPPKP